MSHNLADEVVKAAITEIEEESATLIGKVENNWLAIQAYDEALLNLPDDLQSPEAGNPKHLKAAQAYYPKAVDLFQQYGQFAVLGQPDFEQVELNQGQYLPSAKSLNMPYGVTVTGNWLLVADTANSRLLGWQGRSDLQALQNAPADMLIGQFDSQSKGENRFYGLPMRDSLCWPYAVQAVGNTLAIADSSNNRILLWRWP